MIYADRFPGTVLFRPFFYPPNWRLMLLPLGLLAVGPAYGAFMITTAAAATALEGRRDWWGWLAAVSSPAAVWVVLAGQNTFLSLACFYGGLRLLDRSPATAGILLGLLSYKPQIVLVPLALLAARQWRALAWTAGTVAVLSLASAGVFGFELWLAFIDAAREAGSARVANIMFERIFMHMTTLLAAARIVGLPPGFAGAIQLAGAALAVTAVWFAFRRHPSSDARTAVLVTATFLVSPYTLNYDLLLMMPAAVALFRRGVADGFYPLERSVYLLLWLMPTFGMLLSRCSMRLSCHWSSCCSASSPGHACKPAPKSNCRARRRRAKTTAIHGNMPRGRNTMADEVVAVSAEWASRAWVDGAKYKAMYAASISDRPPSGASTASASTGSSLSPGVHDVDLPATSASAGSRTACSTSRPTASTATWPSAATRSRSSGKATTRPSPTTITYRELHAEVCRIANVLKAPGRKKGDRVTIYLPMIPEAAVRDAGLRPDRRGPFGRLRRLLARTALAGRIQDCDCNVVITADEGLRGGKTVPLKANVDEALERMPAASSTVLVVSAPAAEVPMTAGRDVWWHDERGQPGRPTARPSRWAPRTRCSSSTPRGSTGKPKGVLHTTGGYLVLGRITHEYVFDYRPGDIYWCTADVGWVTGHSYIVYGPLANGATTLMFEGVPNYPGRPAASGRWSTSTRSTSSTPRRPPSAR